MLAYILALAVVIGSFAIYMAAFFFPEVHRKGDIFWSGVGLFYALVLWFCAGRITGALLLGQTASVALLVWFGWQSMRLRWEVTPAPQRTITKKDQTTGLSKLTGGLTKLFQVKSKAQPKPATPSTNAEKDSNLEPETPTSEIPVEEILTVTVDAATSATPTDTTVEETATPTGNSEETAEDELGTETADSEAVPTEEVATIETAASAEQHETDDSEAVPTEAVATTETAASGEQQETQTDALETAALAKDTIKDIEEDELDQEWETGTRQEIVQPPLTPPFERHREPENGETSPQAPENGGSPVADTSETSDGDTEDKTEDNPQDDSETIAPPTASVKPKSTTGGVSKIFSPITGLFGSIQARFSKDKKEKTSQDRPDTNQSETEEDQSETSLNPPQPELDTTVETADGTPENLNESLNETLDTLESDEVAIENSVSAIAENEPEPESETVLTVEYKEIATTEESSDRALASDPATTGENSTETNPASEVVMEGENSTQTNPEAEASEVVMEGDNSTETNPEALEVVIDGENSTQTNPEAEASEVVIEGEDSTQTNPALEAIADIQDSPTKIQGDDWTDDREPLFGLSETEVPGEENHPEHEPDMVRSSDNTQASVENVNMSPDDLSESANPTKLNEPNPFLEIKNITEQKQDRDRE